MKLNFAQRCLTKAAIAIAIAVASGMLFAGAVHAQPAPAQQDAPQAAPGGWHRHGGDPSARVQRGLDDLKKKLNLKPEQESAWSTYAASVTARAKWQAGAQAEPQGGTPERMAQAAKMMHAHADVVDHAAKDAGAFYSVLSQDQKTIFDLAVKRAMHRHGPHGMGPMML